MERLSVGQITARIGSYLDPLLAPAGLFVVEILLRGRRGERVLEVFIDGDEGVTTGACAEVSRTLSKELDEGVLQGEKYTLTVSSPGLDRPLKFPRQYPKHVGRDILLTVRSGDGPTRMEGKLTAAGTDSVTVLLKGADTEREVAYTAISEARIKPRW